MLSVSVMSVFILSVIVLNVVMLSVVAPSRNTRQLRRKKLHKNSPKFVRKAEKECLSKSRTKSFLMKIFLGSCFEGSETIFETFHFIRNLRMGPVSWSVCPRQGFRCGGNLSTGHSSTDFSSTDNLSTGLAKKTTGRHYIKVQLIDCKLVDSCGDVCTTYLKCSFI